MSLDEQIGSKSCKERMNAMPLLEQEWLKDKNSHQHLLHMLLKEKNVLVLEKLIPVFKVIPYSEEIALFAIENLKTLKLKPKIFDYLDCKHNLLNIQLCFDQLTNKNPKFVECVSSYILHFFTTINKNVANDEQLDQLKESLNNPDSNVRKNVIDCLKLFYSRNNTINLKGIKPIIEKEIIEGASSVVENDQQVSIQAQMTPQKIRNHPINVKPEQTSLETPPEFKIPEYVPTSQFESTNQPCHIFEMTDEIQNDLISGLSHSIWKERLEAAEKIAQNLEHAHLFTSELNKRLKDSNNQVFSTALFIIKNANLNFDRDVLLHKLADKKLQQKIKESNLINVTEDDFSGKRSPEIDRMLIEMAIQQGNKSLLSQIAPLESSARKDVREEVKKYKEFCANKSSTFVTPKKTLKVVENVPSKLQTTPLKQKTPTPQKVKNVEKTTITQNDIDNFSLDEPLTLADQRAITGDFFEKYNFFTERDFKKKLEKMECSENQLLQEPNFLKFVYSIKEKNKIMNIKYLELISRLQIIDTPLFCHIIVKIFTDPQIFSESSEICKKLDERKTLIFFIKFICQNKKGKLFEKGAEMVLRVQDKVMIEENCLDVNNYVGKEKQTLINLKAELEKRKEAQIKKTCPFFDEKQPENIEETLVQEFENSVVLDSAVDEALPNDTVIADNPPVSEPQVSEKITPVEKRQKNKNVIEHQNRFKDGKDQKKYFTEDMQTLFQDYKIEASDFIIKHIFEEKKCLCGQKDGFYCCLKKLIDFYADKRYVLSAYEAETFVKLIKNENLLQDLEKIYPKSKILILKNKENHFKTHLLQSFRFREYNMSPLRKKKKPETQKIRSPVPIIQTKTANVDNFVVAETFNDSFDCLEEPALIQNKPDKNAINVFSVTTTSRNSSDSPFDDKKDDREHTQNIFEISKLGKDLQTNRLDSPQKIIEKRLSTNSINNFLITDLYKKSDSAFVTLLQRATDDLPSLFYIANSIVNALIENFEDIKSIKILMILSTNSDFLSEVDFDTMKMLHLRIIKDIQDHGGDFLINLCLNAPVPALLRVYLAILNDNKEIVLKLIWRNSKRKYNQHAQEIMSIFDDFFSKNMELDDLTFKILQLHISEIVSQRGSAVLDFPITGQLHKIVTGMLERLSQNESN